MLSMHRASRKEKGFTLTEAAIVLGIMGLILGAIWVAAAAVYKNMRVSTTSNQLLQIAQSIRSMHATALTMDTSIAGTGGALLLAKAGAIPKDMLDDALNPTVVRDVWTGLVTIDATTVTTAGDSFKVGFPNVPRDACVDLLVRNTGAGRDTGLVNAGAAVGQANTAMPLTVTTAVNTECTNSTANTVFFTFMLKS
jgi:type II secretory pathway pseudopilin PulG